MVQTKKRKWVWKKEIILNAPAMAAHFMSSILYGKAAAIGEKYNYPDIKARAAYSGYKAVEQAALAFAAMHQTVYTKTHRWEQVEEPRVLVQGILGSWHISSSFKTGCAELYLTLASPTPLTCGYFGRDSYVATDSVQYDGEWLTASIKISGPFQLFEAFMSKHMDKPIPVRKKLVQVCLDKDDNVFIRTRNY